MIHFWLPKVVLACSKRDITALRRAVQEGSDVDERGRSFHRTPLITAASGGESDITELLMGGRSPEIYTAKNI